MSETLPVMTEEFWRERLFDVISHGRDLHQVIYHTDYEVWKKVQDNTEALLRGIVVSGTKVLDAGCGYGSAYEALCLDAKYIGIDLSPELVRIAKTRHPHVDFRVGNLTSLPEFEDGYFEVCLCRSLRGMILINLGLEVWKNIERELKRVAKRLYLVEYGDKDDLPLIEIVEGFSC